MLSDTSSEMGSSSGSNGSVAILDVQNALKVLEKNCTNSDKTYICKRLEQTASAIVLLLQGSVNHGSLKIWMEYPMILKQRVDPRRKFLSKLSRNHCFATSHCKQIIFKNEVIKKKIS